jgi:hypothetical protein
MLDFRSTSMKHNTTFSRWARERVFEPPLPELAPVDDSVPRHVRFDDLQVAAERTLDHGVHVVAGDGRREAFEGVVHDEVATDDVADDAEVRRRASEPAAALDDCAFDRRRDLQELGRDREVSLVRDSRPNVPPVAVHAETEVELSSPRHLVRRMEACVGEEEENRERQREPLVPRTDPRHAFLRSLARDVPRVLANGRFSVATGSEQRRLHASTACTRSAVSS